ncbi:hypothetical protein ACP70R_015151 [Stipagrostis hirtigluma subsp. patula]
MLTHEATTWLGQEARSFGATGPATCLARADMGKGQAHGSLTVGPGAAAELCGPRVGGCSRGGRQRLFGARLGSQGRARSAARSAAPTSARSPPPAPAPEADEDRLSALPDDVLVLILLRLDSIAAAAQTSALSRRWRRVWALLPELVFSFPLETHRLHAILSAHQADLRCLLVVDADAAPESLQAWLPVAARRVSGSLVLYSLERGGDGKGGDEEVDAAQSGAALELPCFERASSISLDLGRLGLAVPPAGVFARLTEISLRRVRFRGPCALGDAVSTPRCPCLRGLSLRDIWGVDDLKIHSESLLQMELKTLRGLRRLTVLAPALKELAVIACFLHDRTEPVADISAPQLNMLEWMDLYDPTSVHLCNLEQLQALAASTFVVYGPDGAPHNRDCLGLLQRFKIIQNLGLTLFYLPAGSGQDVYKKTKDIDNYQYLMEEMTMLPDIMVLHLAVVANGHSFGASAFHVLRMCADIRRLVLILRSPTDSEAQTCSSDCICHQPPNWKTEELLFNHLEEVEIRELRGSEHEVSFVKRLFCWATVMKRMTVAFDCFVTESTVKELYQLLRTFCRPETRLEFYMYRGDSMVLFVPED